jgi:hypothetical protein
MPGAMPRVCRVTFQDLDGLRHVVEVDADSVYEAAVLAIRALKKSGFMDLPPGPASKLAVEVREPSVVHEVSVAQVQRWLERGSSNPNDEARKKKLQELMSWTSRS